MIKGLSGISGAGPLSVMSFNYITTYQVEYDCQYMMYRMMLKTVTGMVFEGKMTKECMVDMDALDEVGIIKLVTDGMSHQPEIDHEAYKKIEHKDWFGHTAHLTIQAPAGAGMILMIGGPVNGEMRKAAGLTDLRVIPEVEPLFSAPSNTPVNEKQESYLYLSERVSIQTGGQNGTHFSCRVMVHDSVPEEMRLNLFLECLVEFPLVRIYPEYALYFWFAKQLWVL